MFKKILIANRGEIAVRIIRTCREMGIATVAVYSEADGAALHVISADEAVCIGPPNPKDSYLNIDKIIEVAKQSGAEAIHPGYGFLAENDGFAERCRQEGIAFIGPPPEVIKSLGDKTEARRIMQHSKVPFIPGMTAPGNDFAEISRFAEEIGYPVIIKAAAGGGGKGMRVVNTPDQLEAAFETAGSEAQTAFGNGAVYLEKYLEKSRHVEIQILADHYGNIIHLCERECSIQRRHQKIIEETPSPGVDPKLREDMGQAAVNAARAAGYQNAGTVEFMLDEQGKFYFMEVNTRLQVEHPVTEMITGIDLVREQIAIASGLPLVYHQQDIQPRGHAIECRIYAEDPENSFMPSPGTICYLKEPAGPGIRVDSGIYSGFTVPTAYDPILSKLVAYDADRPAAIKKMARALGEYAVLGIKTPIPFLLDVIRSEQFANGDTWTRMIDDAFANWRPKSDDIDLAAIAYAAFRMAFRRSAKTSLGNEDSHFQSPWETLGNWVM